MDGYHIYEEIGRGQHSLIYKGREKQTVKYVAIKSIDKSKLDKVLHEVRMMYRLDHPNCLRFYKWYETRHHIWLILEYCTGGSLKELLYHDKRLPESAIRVFGCDLVHALHYLHSNGILFCDLKPSNILLNEYGVLKLCDFALSIPIDLLNQLEQDVVSSPAGDGKNEDVDDSSNKNGSKQQQQQQQHQRRRVNKRGTPCYMAPELFSNDGLHSYASDFWSFGCVLYELALGHQPFFSNSFSELVRRIQTAPLELPLENEENDGLSVQFKNLLRSLLRKDPAKRLTWPALLMHEFWGGMPMPKLVPMPINQAYQNYLKTREYVPSCPEEDSDDEEELDGETTASSPFGESMPRNRGMLSPATTNSRRSQPPMDASIRMSQQAKRNLLRESADSGVADSYARKSFNGSVSAAGGSVNRGKHHRNQDENLSDNHAENDDDLVLENPDKVLDFEYRPDTPEGLEDDDDEEADGYQDERKRENQTRKSIHELLDEEDDAFGQTGKPLGVMYGEDDATASTGSSIPKQQARPRTAPFPSGSSPGGAGAQTNNRGGATNNKFDDEVPPSHLIIGLGALGSENFPPADHHHLVIHGEGSDFSDSTPNEERFSRPLTSPTLSSPPRVPAVDHQRQTSHKPVVPVEVAKGKPKRKPSVHEAAAELLRMEFGETEDINPDDYRHEVMDDEEPAPKVILNYDEIPITPSRNAMVVMTESPKSKEGGSMNRTMSEASINDELVNEVDPFLIETISPLQTTLLGRLVGMELEALVPEDMNGAGLPMQALLTDPSDHTVKPIVGNPTNAALPVLKFNPRSLPFRNIPCEEVARLNGADLEAFLSQVFRALSGGHGNPAGNPSSAPSGGSAIANNIIQSLGYLYTLCRIPRLANVIVSSSLLALLIRLGTKPNIILQQAAASATGGGNTAHLGTGTSSPIAPRSPRSPKNTGQYPNRPITPPTPPPPPSYSSVMGSTATASSSLSSNAVAATKSQLRKLKVRVAIVVAVLIRYATYIAPRLGEEGLLGLFVTFSQEDYPPLRRYGTAGLGELLFYITANSWSPGGSQDNSSVTGNSNNIGGQQVTDLTQTNQQWKISGAALKQLSSCLGAEDEVTRHYAAKTYENVLSTTPDTNSLSTSSSSSSSNNPPGLRFATHDVAKSLLYGAVREKSEQLRSTCAMALAHLVRLNRRLLPRLAEQEGWGFLVNGLEAVHGSPRVQQAFLNIINLVLSHVVDPNTNIVPVTGPMSPRFAGGAGFNQPTDTASSFLHHHQRVGNNINTNVASNSFANNSTPTTPTRGQSNLHVSTFEGTSNRPSGGVTPSRLGAERITREALFGSKSKVKQSLLKALLQLMNHGQTFTVRSKAVLTLALLLRAQPSEFGSLLNLRFAQTFDRLYGKLAIAYLTGNKSFYGGVSTQLGSTVSKRVGGRQSSAPRKRASSLRMEEMIAEEGGVQGTLHMRRCLYFLLISTVMAIEESIQGTVRAATKMAPVIASGRTVASTSPEASYLQRFARETLPTLVHVSTSRSMRSFVSSNPELVSSLGKLVRASINVEAESAPEFHRQVMTLTENIVQQHESMLRPEVAVEVFRGLIGGIWKKAVFETPCDLVCLRLAMDLTELYICNPVECANEDVQVGIANTARRFLVMIMMPKMKQLFLQPAPVPQLCLNLLHSSLNRDATIVHSMWQTKNFMLRLFDLLPLLNHGTDANKNDAGHDDIVDDNIDDGLEEQEARRDSMDREGGGATSSTLLETTSSMEACLELLTSVIPLTPKESLFTLSPPYPLHLDLRVGGCFKMVYERLMREMTSQERQRKDVEDMYPQQQQQQHFPNDQEIHDDDDYQKRHDDFDDDESDDLIGDGKFTSLGLKSWSLVESLVDFYNEILRQDPRFQIPQVSKPFVYSILAFVIELSLKGSACKVSVWYGRFESIFVLGQDADYDDNNKKSNNNNNNILGMFADEEKKEEDMFMRLHDGNVTIQHQELLEKAIFILRVMMQDKILSKCDHLFALTLLIFSSMDSGAMLGSSSSSSASSSTSTQTSKMVKNLLEMYLHEKSVLMMHGRKKRFLRSTIMKSVGSLSQVRDLIDQLF